MTRTLLLAWFWIRVTVMSMHFSSFKCWISMLEEVSQIIKRRESLSSPIYYLRILDGRVVRWWKTEKGKKSFWDMNFCWWEHETLELYEGLWGNKLHIDFTEFQLPNWQNDAISCDEFFWGKAGHYIVSLFRLLFSALSIGQFRYFKIQF